MGTVVLRAVLSPFLQYGMMVEAHQQNTILEFASDGNLSRLVCQELGGGIFWDAARIEQVPWLNFRADVYARDDIFRTLTDCLAGLRHILLRMHIWPLLKAVSAHFGLDI